MSLSDLNNRYRTSTGSSLIWRSVSYVIACTSIGFAETTEIPEPSSSEPPVSSQIQALDPGLPPEKESQSDKEIPNHVDIHTKGSVTADREANTITYIGAPTVYMAADNGLEVFAEKAVLDQSSSLVTFTGDLAIFREGQLTRADRAVYHTESRDIETYGIRAKANGMILRSGEFVMSKDEQGKQYIEGTDASVSSEDDQNPETWIKAKRIRLYPDDRLNFTNLTFNYKNVPFFYFPYFTHSLNPREGYMPVLGSRSYWGAFLLNRYGVLVGNRRIEKHRPTADYLATTHVDLRSRRGLGIGEDLVNIRTEASAPDMSGLSLYYAYDSDPTISPSSQVRPMFDKNRWRIALQDMWKLDVSDAPQTKWYLKANINALSDKYMLRDFYENLYETNAEPDNTVVVERTSKTSALTILQRMPINDFYITDQRSEISFDHIRTPLFGTRIAYESQTSFGWMRQVVPAETRASIRSRLDQMASGATKDFWERMLVTDGFFRFHTYHELSTSTKVGGVLNLTPKIGAGYTGYIDPAGELSNFNQGLFYVGVDANVKFSKNYSSVKCDWLGVDGLNHIIQPYVTVMYLGANALNTTYPMIDGNSSSTNPLALDVGQMSDIDSMSTRSVIRYGMKNFLMTQRDDAPSRWLTWDVFMDAYLHNTDSESDFSNVYSLMSWHPLPWFSYVSSVQFPLLGDNKRENYREYNNSVSFQISKPLELSVGHRYLSKHPILSDSNQLTLRALYRLTEETAIGGYWRWELERHRMEIQEINLYKNMGSWYLGMGVYTRKNGNKDELGIGFSFTLMETGTHMPFKLN